MESKGTKIALAVALCLAVVGVSIGFAAFSNTLTISSSAEVKPDASNFDVNFSSVNTEEKDGAVVGVETPINTNEDKTKGLYGNEATIDNTGDPKITGLKANFTEPGQKVTYSFYAHNAGKLDAYLKSITYGNVTGENASKVCIGKTGTTQALVDEACKGISVTTAVGSLSLTGSQSDILGHSLLIDNYEPVVVTIEYAAGSKHADGDFDVKFGDITLLYSSVD